MKAKEIRLKSQGEMKKDVVALQEKLRELRFKIHSQELKNPKEVAKVRKDIARLLTIIKENDAATGA